MKELKKKKNGNKKKKLISDIIAQCLHPLVVVVEVVMQFLKNCLITIKCAGVQDKLHFFISLFLPLEQEERLLYNFSIRTHTHTSQPRVLDSYERIVIFAHLRLIFQPLVK